jgi:hypothetical protein
LQEHSWVKSLKEQYLPQLDEKLSFMSINSSNLSLYQTMYQIHKQTFRDWAQAQNQISEMGLMPIENKKRFQLIHFVKNKAIDDIMGADPFKEKIEEMRKYMTFTPWLQPEGKNAFFRYKSDSKYWFSGEIVRNGVHYFYDVSRSKDLDYYEMDIQYITGDKSYQAFHTMIRAETNPANSREINVTIYNAYHDKYKWKFSESDYLRFSYRANEQAISMEERGNIHQLFDNKHGLPAASLTQKVGTGEFSEKNAIRTAVRYFILEYNRGFKR